MALRGEVGNVAENVVSCGVQECEIAMEVGSQGFEVLDTQALIDLEVDEFRG